MSAPIIATSLDADGVLLATIDMPGRTMNVFSVDLMDALDALMDRVDSDPKVLAVVLTSGKPSFLAGADLVMVRGYCDAARRLDAEQMTELCGRLGRQFVRLEASPKPWVAALNGLALGGGLELAMACRVRLVVDDPRVQLGLPEVRWGLLPGAGGTQRLPRLVGFELATDMLLTGRSLNPEQAVQAGLVERATVPSDLLSTARQRALEMVGQVHDPRIKFAHLAQDGVPAYSRSVAREVGRRFGIDDDTWDHYPAHEAIVDCVLKGAHQSLAEATATEMQQFLRLMFDPVAGNMVRTLFLERLRAEKELAVPSASRISRLRIGPLSEHNAVWAQALGRVKIAQAIDTDLELDAIDIELEDGTVHRVQLAPHAGHKAQGAVAVLSPPGPYGRVLEIAGAGPELAAACAALAARLGALPWPTPGPQSVLQCLHGRSLPEQAGIALGVLDTAHRTDPALLDVVACLSGVSPAWSGGPLTWAWQHRDHWAASLPGAGREAWERIRPQLAQAFA